MALGEILKKKRLAHGWTIQYVAERTHLLTRVIEALETETFAKIPAPIYGRGFIRQYCTLLEIDPAPLLDEYNAITSGKARPSSVRPAVHELPQRPLEPIHTGGHRTLPPDPKHPPRAPAAHKRVESAEASFTAVPKPEILPGAPTPEPPQDAPTPPAPEAIPQPQPQADLPFTLTGDALPPIPPTPQPEAKPAPAKPRRKAVERTTLTDLTPRRPAGASIFGPQHPVPDPPNPQVGTLKTLLSTTGKAIADGAAKTANTLRGLNRPKVRRMGDDIPEPLLSRRLIIQMLTVAGALVALTLIILAFRYVFQISSDAEVDAPISFTNRPVAQPPAPFFES